MKITLLTAIALTLFSVPGHGTERAPLSVCQAQKRAKAGETGEVTVLGVFSHSLYDGSGFYDVNGKCQITLSEGSATQDDMLKSFKDAVYGDIYDQNFRQFSLKVSGRLIDQGHGPGITVDKILSFKRL